MSQVITFTVPAVPVAQPRQRHRVVSAGGRTFAHNYTPKRDPVNDFKASVRQAAQQAYQGGPLEGPLVVSLLFLMPRPGRLRWKKRPMPRLWHANKPDAENLAKSVLDALTGTVWVDDSQVSHLICSKVYAAGTEQPAVTVRVQKLEGDPG